MTDNRPYIEYDGEVPENHVRKRVPLADLAAQHRKRYLFRSSIGDIILKKLGRLELEMRIIEMGERFDEYARLMSEGEPYWREYQAGRCDAETLAKINEIGMKVRPYTWELTFPIFVEPKITSMEELDALLSAMTAKEQGELLELVTRLARVREEPIDGGVLTVAQEFRIPLASDLTVENMTNEQYNLLQDAIAKRNAAIEAEYKKAQRDAVR